jgi:hypothetical protein
MSLFQRISIPQRIDIQLLLISQYISDDDVLFPVYGEYLYR